MIAEEEAVMRELAALLEEAPGVSSDMTHDDGRKEVANPDEDKPEKEKRERYIDPRRIAVSEWFDTAPSNTGIREVIILSTNREDGYRRRLINIEGVFVALYEHEVDGATYLFRPDIMDNDLTKLKDTIHDIISERKTSIYDDNGNKTTEGIRDVAGVKYIRHANYWESDPHSEKILSVMRELVEKYGPNRLINQDHACYVLGSNRS